jgi:uncharacterized protein YegP (UPF0339 family)
MTAPDSEDTEAVDEALRHARAWFEIYENGVGFWFELTTAEHRALLVGGPFAQAGDVQSAIDAIRSSAATFCPCMTAVGTFYFMVRLHDGTVLGSSEPSELPLRRDARLAAVRRL